MYRNGKVLIQKYFQEQTPVASDVEFFNDFVDRELQKIGIMWLQELKKA